MLHLTGERVELAPYRIVWLTRLIHSSAFELAIAAVIMVNAVALAILTLPDMSPETIQVASALDRIAFGIYVAELISRILSYGLKPWKFFTRGWNIFDFIVVGLAPFLQSHVAILRLLRLARLVRIFRFLPEVRVLTQSIIKSIPPLLSMSALIALLLFLYGMAGTYLFGEQAPQSWGDIITSLKSLFVLLTLEGFAEYFDEALRISVLAVPFFLSYVFIIVFTVLNVLIGVVLHAMDQAREEVASEQPAVSKLEHLSASIRLSVDDGHISEDERQRLLRELDSLRETLATPQLAPPGAGERVD